MDHASIATPTTNKLQQSMSEPPAEDTFRNSEKNCRNERVIPIHILSNPHTNLTNSPSLNQESRKSTTTDKVHNNNEYNNKLNNIICSDNNNDENLQKRSLLVTLEDGTTTETLGSIRDIVADNNILKNLQNTGKENVNGVRSNNPKNQRQKQ